MKLNAGKFACNSSAVYNENVVIAASEDSLSDRSFNAGYLTAVYGKRSVVVIDCIYCAFFFRISIEGETFSIITVPTNTHKHI